MKARKIQLEFTHRPTHWWGWRYRNPVQTRPFWVGVRITNIDTVPIRDIEVSGVSIKSAEGKSVNISFSDTVAVSLLNPGKGDTIWVGKMATDMHGLVEIRLTIKTNEPDTVLDTYQYHRAIRERSGDPDKNAWWYFFSIRSLSEQTQSVFNWLLLLASLTALFGGAHGLYHAAVWLKNAAHQFVVILLQNLV